MTTARLVFRIAGLLILLVGGLAAATAGTPRDATYADFAAALDRGEVVQVVPDRWSDGTVSTADWSTGPFQWRSGQVTEDGRTPAADFRAQMSDRGVEVETPDRDSWIQWPFGIPTWFGVLVATVWALVFLTMLASRPRYGNRWAWFWLFTIGQVGAPLYLILEPIPLWRAVRGEEPVPVPEGEDPPGPRWTGPQGCLVSILTGLGAAMLAAAVGWAINSLLA